MVSEVDICNNALLKIRGATITALDQLDSTEATTCNIMYSQVRDDVLHSHPWNFAIKQINLQKSATDPLFEFSSQFQLPADCLRVLKTATASSKTIPYKIKGRFLHADESEVLIEYIARIKDTTKYSSQFIDALATRLASEIAYTITASDGLADRLAKQALIKLKEAKRRDGQEGTPDRLTANTIVNSRQFGKHI